MFGYRVKYGIPIIAAAVLICGCGKKEIEQPSPAGKEGVTPPATRETPVLFDAPSLAGKTEKEVEKILGEYGDSWLRRGFEDEAPRPFWQGKDTIVKTYGSDRFEVIDVEYEKDTGLISKASFYFLGNNKFGVFDPEATRKTVRENLGIINGYGCEQYEYVYADGDDTFITPNGNIRGYTINYGWLFGEVDRVIGVDVFY